MSSTLIQKQVLQTLEFVMCARCTLHETQSETQGQQQPCSKYICVKSYFICRWHYNFTWTMDNILRAWTDRRRYGMAA